MTPTDGVPFHENALFRAISAEQLAQLGLDPPIMTFAAGDIIFEEQSQGDSCYLIESGMVRISKETAAGGQETLGFIGPGEFFGEVALFYSTSRSARATAAIETRVRRVAPLELTTAIANAGREHLRHVNTNLAEYLADSDRFRDIGVAVGMIAHDTRSPLATINNAAQLLEDLLQRDERDIDQLLRFVRMIQRTSASAIENLEDLLADIRGEIERIEVNVDVGELVQDVSTQLQGLLRTRNVEFQAIVDYSGGLLCERRELVRALVNLLRNAVEALPDTGTAQLHVGREGDFVVFTVTDTGCGIPVEHQGRIFERRFTHGKAGGTGLGLNQVRSAVERHRGTIDVDSRVGEGTTFRVRIPESRRDPESQEVK